MRLLLSMALTLACACDSSPTVPSLTDLTVQGGFNDVSFNACSPPDSESTSKVFVHYPGLLEQALAAGNTIETAVDVGDPDLTLSIRSNLRLDDECRDDGAIVGVTQFEPISGTATFTVVPYAPGDIDGCNWGRGSVSLDNVVVELEGNTLAMEPGLITGSDLPGQASDTGDCLGTLPASRRAP